MVNKIQNGNGLSERTDIKKFKLGTKLGKQINNTSLTFEKKEQIDLCCWLSFEGTYFSLSVSFQY